MAKVEETQEGVPVLVPSGKDAVPARDTDGAGAEATDKQMKLKQAAENVQLAMRIAAGDLARAAIDENGGNLAERRQLEATARDGEAARTRMVESNGGLVVKQAEGFVGHGLPLDDLIQEGYIGLMTAVRKYDYTKGFAFSTYATWWIRQSILRAISKTGRAIYLPDAKVQALYRLHRCRGDLTMKLGRKPTAEELARDMGITTEEVIKAERHETVMVSLATPISHDGSSVLGDLLEDDGQGSDPAAAAFTASMHQDLDLALGTLTEREADIIARRFGLNRDEPASLRDVAAAYGLSAEGIRRIQKQALAKLRRPEILQTLRGYAA